MVVLTIRLIKSFEYRTIKNLVLKDIDINITIKDLKNKVQEIILNTNGLKPYHNNNFNVMKLYVKAHGSKTTNLVINLGNDEEKVLNDNKTLKELDIEDETEISYFNLDLYNEYLKNPNIKWE